MKRPVILIPILAALGIGAVTAVPAFSDTSDTVTATVSTAAVACLTVDTTNISYGTLAFSNGAPVFGQNQVAGIHSCANAPESLMVQGSNATGSGGASWTLVNAVSCPTPNQFRHNIQDPDGGDLNLTTAPQPLTTMLANATISTLDTLFFMPCTGSTGAGLTMTTSIVFTAAIP